MKPSATLVTHAFHETLETRPHPPSLPKSFHCFLAWPYATWIPTEQDNCQSCWSYAISRAFASRLAIASSGSISNTFQRSEITKLWQVSLQHSSHSSKVPKSLLLASIQPNLRRFLTQGFLPGAPLNLSIVGTTLPEWLTYYGNHAIYLDEHQLLDQFQCHPQSLHDAWLKVATHGLASYPMPHGPFRCTPPRRLPVLDTHAIMTEIFLHGPTPTGMMIYPDFYQWDATKGKIYSRKKSHKTDTPISGHAVCLVGWTPAAWIVSNSWGMDWGISTIPRTNSAFKGEFLVRRGENVAGIEENVVVADPIL